MEREVVRIKQEVASVGRDPESLLFSAGMTFGNPDATSFKAFTHNGGEGEMDAPSSLDETIALVHRYRVAGFTDLMVSTDWTTPDDYAEKLAWFANSVMASV